MQPFLLYLVMIDTDIILNDFCNYMREKDALLLQKMLPLSIESDIKGLAISSSSNQVMDYKNRDWVEFVKYWREFNKSKNYYH